MVGVWRITSADDPSSGAPAAYCASHTSSRLRRRPSADGIVVTRCCTRSALRWTRGRRRYPAAPHRRPPASALRQSQPRRAHARGVCATYDPLRWSFVSAANRWALWRGRGGTIANRAFRRPRRARRPSWRRVGRCPSRRGCRRSSGGGVAEQLLDGLHVAGGVKHALAGGMAALVHPLAAGRARCDDAGGGEADTTSRARRGRSSAWRGSGAHRRAGSCAGCTAGSARAGLRRRGPGWRLSRSQPDEAGGPPSNFYENPDNLRWDCQCPTPGCHVRPSRQKGQRGLLPSGYSRRLV